MLNAPAFEWYAVPMWPIFLAIHLVGLTGYNLLLRRSLLNNVDKWTLATIMQTGVALPILVLAFIHPLHIHDYSQAIIGQIIVTAGLIIALHATNVTALHHLETGIYSILFNLRIVFTTIFGIAFLSERIIPLQIIGGLVIFLAVLALRGKTKKHITQLGLRWGIAAAVVISVLNLSEKSLINHVGYFGYAIPTMLLATIVMWGVLYARNGRIKPQVIFNKGTLLLMTLRAMSAHGALLALTFGATLSIYTYVSSLSVVLTVILGILILKEREHLRQKLTATAIAFVGLTLILIANLHR